MVVMISGRNYSALLTKPPLPLFAELPQLENPFLFFFFLPFLTVFCARSKCTRVRDPCKNH